MSQAKSGGADKNNPSSPSNSHNNTHANGINFAQPSSTNLADLENANAQKKPPTESMRYGDLIYLHVEGIDGFVQSTGFTNTSVFVQKDNFGSQTFCRNSRDFVFQIQPKMNFDSRKDYRQAAKFYQTNVASKPIESSGPAQGSGGEHDGKTAADHQRQLQKQAQELATYKKKLQLLKKKMNDEEETNRKLVERRIGEYVQYGAEIQLFHIDSDSYLCAKKTCAEIEKTCNRVELIEKPSPAIYFKILPRYKFRQEGDKIKYDDQVIFLNVKINLYLHVCEIQIPIEKPIELPLIPGTTSNEITPVHIDRRCPPVNYVPTYEMNVSTNFSRFKCVPFCIFSDDDRKYIRGGCVVQLRHSELGGVMCSDDKDFTADGLAEVFLWKFKGKENDVENFNTQSLFEIELAQDFLKGMIGRTAEKVYNHRFRLRHINTGRLVTVQRVMYNEKELVTLGLAEHLHLEMNPNPLKSGDNYRIQESPQQVKDLEDSTLFQFISTNADNDSRIQNLTCVKVQHCQSEEFLTWKKKALFNIVKQPISDVISEQTQSIQQNPVGASDFQGKLFVSLEDEDVNHANRHVIELKKIAGYEDAFFIQIVEKDIFRDTMFVHTSVSILKKSIPYLCLGSDSIPKERFNQMDFIMKTLDSFAKCQENDKNNVQIDIDGGDGGDFDMNTIKDKTKKRQKILRELYLVEYIVQILYFPFATKSFRLERLQQDDLITRLCQIAYELLKSAVGGYEINEMYATQWINFFFSQAMKTNKKNDIYAQSTVEELLSDNKKLLENQITPQIIKQFITLCKVQEKDKKLIKLLTALCTCYGNAVSHNQNNIVKYLLEDRETKEKLLMPLRVRDDIVEVRVENNDPKNPGIVQGYQFLPLGSLEDFSNGRDQGRIFKYFKSLVDLGSNLNTGRNDGAYSQFTNIFSFEAVFQVVYDQSLTFDLRSCFIKLMTAMHLDREPLEPLVIPTTTVVIHEIPQFDDLVPSYDHITYPIMKSKVAVPPQQCLLKDFVINFLKTENGVQDLSDKKKNKFVSNLIEVLRFMLTHGFYNDQQELNQLALPLIMLLDGSDDVYDENENSEYNSTDRYKYTQKNEIILMSKKVQCDCLIFISQLELDGRSELYLSKLKKEFELQNGDFKGKSESQSRAQSASKPNRSKSLIQLSAANAGEQTNVEFLNTVASMKGFEQEIGEIYICILFDLMLYKYNDLNYAAFELLIKFFNRKASMLECISNIQILENKKSIEVLKKVLEYKSQLQVFRQESDSFMNESDRSSLATKLKIGEVFSRLTRFLILSNNDVSEISDLLAASFKNRVISVSKGSDNPVLTEEQEEYIMYLNLPMTENKENQRMMRNFNLDDLSIFFIEYRTEESDAAAIEHQQLMRQCYRFLIKFVRGNLINQQKIRDNLESFLKDIDNHSLAQLLVYEIYKDNKNFLNLNAGKILRQIINASEKCEMQDSKKGSMFKLLVVFCRFKDKLVRANQQDIVTFLANKGAQSNILYLFHDEGFKEINKYIQQQKQVMFPKIQTESEIDPNDPSASCPIIYVTNQTINLMAFVDLLSLCCEGKSDVAEQRCQDEVITLPSALRIIEACDYFWPLKKTFLDYVWQCFLDSNSKTVFSDENADNVKCIWKIAEVILDDLINMIDTADKRADTDVYIKFPYKSATTVRQESLSFVIDSILPFFKYLFKRKDIIIDHETEPIINVFAKQLVNFYNAFKGNKDAKLKAYNMIGYMYSKPSLSRFLDSLPHPMKGQNLGTLALQQKKLKLEQQSQEQPLQLFLNNINMDAAAESSESSKLTQMLQSIQSSQEVRHMVEMEFDELLLWITNIELRVKDVVLASKQYTMESFENLTFHSIVSAILQMLSRHELSKQLHLIALQIIRKLIEVENKNFVTTAADWDTDDYIEFKPQILAKQDALVEIGAIQFLCNHISESDDEDILEQCLLIAISLLLGGNKRSQEAFLNYFQEQDCSENRVLVKIKQILFHEFDQAKDYLQEKNAKLTMMAKAQDRQAQIKMRQAMRDAAISKSKDPEQEKKEHAEMFAIQDEGSKNENGIELGDGTNAFDDTLENVMTIDESNEGASMLSGEGEGEENKAEIEAKASLTKCIRILRFIQLLVEGHYTPLQEHFREQKTSEGNQNPKTFDFVAQIANMLGQFEKSYVNSYSCELGFQLMDTLIELIQGPCKENQRTLVTSKVIDNCRDLISQGAQERELRIKGFFGDKIELLDGLKQKAVTLLLSIIEGPIDNEIMKTITVSLDDFLVVMERLSYVYNKFIREVLNMDPDQVELEDIQDEISKDSFDDDGIQEGFNIFILIRTLADCNPPVKDKIAPFVETHYFNFFNFNTGYLEIQYNPELMQRVYFPIKPVCRYLQKQTRSILMQSIDRTSPQQKILGLLRAIPEIVDEMQHIEMLSKSTIEITPTKLNLLRDISTVIALLICLLVLIFYEYNVEFNDNGDALLGPTAPSNIKEAIRILGYIQFCTALTLLMGEMYTRAHLIVRTGWRQYNAENKIRFQSLIKSDKEGGDAGYSVIKAADMSPNDARLMLLIQGPYIPEFEVEGTEDKEFGHFMIRLEYMWTCSRFFISNGKVLFLMIYSSMSLLGIFASPVFYSMQLIDIINRFPSLSNVIKSVTKNSSQLVMAAMLELILVYIYTVLLFTFFFDHYFNDDIKFNATEKGDMLCRSLFHCIVSTMNFGLRAGGGIGDALPSNSYFNESKEVYYLRSLNDLSFFMIIITLFFNIIFGIIIDTFAGLRDEKAQMEDDMRNVCFICGIDRQSIDKDSEEGFVSHIKKEHNLWQYVFFVIHLNEKDTTDYNGTESFIAEKLEQDDITWFPFNKAICLEKDKYLIPQEE